MSSLVSALPAVDRRVTWIELFFDLVFVAAISQLGAPLAEHYDGSELWRYGFLLLVTWWAWHGYVMYATRYGSDDTRERLTTMLQMVAVIFMAANAEAGLDSTSSAGFAAAYGGMRLLLAGAFACRWQDGAPMAREYAVGFGAAALLWLLSSAVSAPARYLWWAGALGLDLGTSRLAARHLVRSPPHAAHLPERYGLFTLIWLGEAIVGVMRGIQAQPAWSPGAALTALSGVGLVCGAWWAYFNWTASTSHRPVRCAADGRVVDVWTFAHLPLYAGLGLIGLGVEHAVKQGGWHLLHGEELGVAATGVLLLGGSLAALRGCAPGRNRKREVKGERCR